MRDVIHLDVQYYAVFNSSCKICRISEKRIGNSFKSIRDLFTVCGYSSLRSIFPNQCKINMSDQIFNQARARYQTTQDNLETKLESLQSVMAVLNTYADSQLEPDEETLVKLLADIAANFDQSVMDALPDNFKFDTW